MSINSKRRHFGGRRVGAAIMAVAVGSVGLVTATSTVSGAAPVNATVELACSGADPDSAALLGTAAAILGSSTVPVNLNISGGDVPASAGLNQELNGEFNWTASMGQALIDKAAGIVQKLDISDIVVQQVVRGPATPNEFSGGNPGPIAITPAVGVPASIPIGTVGGKVETNGGGIVTFRVGTVTLSAKLAAAGADLPQLNLTCAPKGSNLIAKTTVRDPDAPVVNPEVLSLTASGGQTVTADLLNDVISEGKTPLQPETLKITEQPAQGSASITNGVYSFQAPNEVGVYSTTYEVCGAPKADGGIPGIDEVQYISLGANWKTAFPGPYPVAFSLKVGEEETPLIWTVKSTLPFLFPVPRGGITPTPENWAPADREGLVSQYLLGVEYVAPTAAQMQSAIEAIPSVGAGNVKVEEVRSTPASEGAPTKVVGFKVTYIGAKGQQDVPDIALGQWYSVLPTEILDTLTGALGSIGEGDGETPDPNAPEPPTVDQALAAIQAAFAAGQPISDQMWDDLSGAIVNGILDEVLKAVPDILKFLNEVFPQKPVATVTEQGEVPTPPQPLCAQGIVDVTVSEAAATGGPAVGGLQQSPLDNGRGVGFVG